MEGDIEIIEEGEFEENLSNNNNIDDDSGSEIGNDSPSWELASEVPTGHFFYLKTFKTPTYCQICEGLLWGLRKQGLSCEVCSYVTHEKCLGKISTHCFVPTAIENHDYDSNKFLLKHHWIGGNIPKGSKCMVCTKPTSKKGDFSSSRCASCTRTIHNECRNNNPNHPLCSPTLGPLYFCRDLMKRSWTSYRPLLVFVNSKSGGQQGPQILRRMRGLLCSEQVIDMFAQKPVGPLPALEKYVHVPNLHILVCGGDGTAGWVLSVLDKMENLPASIPPVAMLPLGTGNDLARVLNFGGGYTGEDLFPILHAVLNNSRDINLDRWSIKITEESGDVKDYVINNYFSLGLDAAIALKFHETRESNPNLFKSRALNKGFYGVFGFQNIVLPPRTIKELDLKLTVDGKEIDLSKFENLEGVVFLNIPSYAGGSNLWGNVKEGEPWEPCSMYDGKMEIVGLSNAAQLVGIQTGVIHGARIAQGSDIQIEVNPVEVQVDGEPFRVKKFRASISLFKKSPVLQLIK